MSHVIDRRKFKTLVEAALYGQGTLRVKDLYIARTIVELGLDITEPWEVACITSHPVSSEDDIKRLHENIENALIVPKPNFEVTANNWLLYVARSVSKTITQPFVVIELLDPFEPLDFESVLFFRTCNDQPSYVQNWSSYDRFILNIKDMGFIR